jgi:hypothetical protein
LPKREFSKEAKAVFDAGRELWKYYHSKGTKDNPYSSFNVNASLYDIREFFKGRSEKGRINTKSDDKKFNELDTNLKEALKILAEKIEPKVYEYGFLLE